MRKKVVEAVALASALGVVVVPVHRFVGTTLLPPRPATNWISLLVVP